MLGSAAVAEHGAGTTSKYGGHPPRLPGSRQASDRVNPAMKTMELPPRCPVGDRTSAHPGLDKLRKGDDSVLALGDSGDRPVERGALFMHGMNKAPRRRVLPRWLRERLAEAAVDAGAGAFALKAGVSEGGGEAGAGEGEVRAAGEVDGEVAAPAVRRGCVTVERGVAGEG